MSPLISGVNFSRGFGFRKKRRKPFGNGGNANAISPGNGYIYHTFTSPGTFVIDGDGSLVVEVLAVGGGGNGASSPSTVGGGGGAGGLVYRDSVSAIGSYSITIGGPGSPTTTSGLVPEAYGGGVGEGSSAGSPGGSGGGARGRGTGSGTGNRVTGTSTPAGSPVQGYPGNSGADGNSGAGGGAGGPATTPFGGGPGVGGPGVSYPQFAGPLIGVPALPGTYAAGGPGAPEHTGISGTPGQANTGNGGGGSHNPGGVAGPQPAGGSGIVVIRYLT